MAKCVVLGADGFIGSHLVEELVAGGHSVRAFDRFKNKQPRSLPENLGGVEIMAGDFMNRHDLEAAVEGMDYVFHLISTTTPATSGTDPLLDIETNIRMSVELLEICRHHSVKRVIFPSTGGAIYGRDQAEAFRETDLAEPLSPYAIGKLAIEGYLAYYKHAFDLDYLALRVSNPYGERQNIIGSQGVIPIFLNLIKHGKPLTIYGDGSSTRDYIYIKDLVRIMTKMFDKPIRYNLYNVGSSEAVSLSDLIAAMDATTGKKARINFLPARPTDVHTVHLDLERLGDEFGLEDLTKLEDGLGKTWQYVLGLES